MRLLSSKRNKRKGKERTKRGKGKRWSLMLWNRRKELRRYSKENKNKLRSYS